MVMAQALAQALASTVLDQALVTTAQALALAQEWALVWVEMVPTQAQELEELASKDMDMAMEHLVLAQAQTLSTSP